MLSRPTALLILASAVWFSNFQASHCRAQPAKRPNILFGLCDDLRYPHGDGGPQRQLSELYDLANDPLESRNLINDPAQQQNIEQLSSQLAEIMAATGITVDSMPIDEGIKENLPDKAIR